MFINEFKAVDSLSNNEFEIFVRDLFQASGWTDAVITEVGNLTMSHFPYCSFRQLVSLFFASLFDFFAS